MKPVKFKGMNSVYTAPGCDDLPAMQRNSEKDGIFSVTSAWKPSEEELQILNSGGSVCLTVVGGQPPVCLWAQDVGIVESKVDYNFPGNPDS